MTSRRRIPSTLFPSLMRRYTTRLRSAQRRMATQARSQQLRARHDARMAQSRARTQARMGASSPADIQARKQRALQRQQMALQRQFLGEDLGIAMADWQRNYPIQLRNLRSEAAARGAYESAGRFQGQDDLTYQMQQGIAEAQRNYYRALQEMALQEKGMRI